MAENPSACVTVNKQFEDALKWEIPMCLRLFGMLAYLFLFCVLFSLTLSVSPHSFHGILHADGCAVVLVQCALSLLHSFGVQITWVSNPSCTTDRATHKSFCGSCIRGIWITFIIDSHLGAIKRSCSNGKSFPFSLCSQTIERKKPSNEFQLASFFCVQRRRGLGCQKSNSL